MHMNWWIFDVSEATAAPVMLFCNGFHGTVKVVHALGIRIKKGWAVFSFVVQVLRLEFIQWKRRRVIRDCGTTGE